MTHSTKGGRFLLLSLLFSLVAGLPAPISNLAEAAAIPTAAYEDLSGVLGLGGDEAVAEVSASGGGLTFLIQRPPSPVEGRVVRLRSVTAREPLPAISCGPAARISPGPNGGFAVADARNGLTLLRLFDPDARELTAADAPHHPLIAGDDRSVWLLARDGGVRRLAVGGSMDPRGGAIPAFAGLPLQAWFRYLFLALPDERLVLIDRSDAVAHTAAPLSGGRFVTCPLQSREIEAGRAVYEEQRKRVEVQSDGRRRLAKPLIVVAAAVSGGGSVCMLLSPVQPAEGAVVQCFDSRSFAVEATYRCAVPTGFRPSRLAVTDSSLVLVSGDGKAAEYAREPAFVRARTELSTEGVAF